MDLTLKVWRQKNRNAQGALETYNVSGISENASFLEMLDVMNEQLINEGTEPVAFDHDCREGICGSCSLYINGEAHGPAKMLQLVNYICACLKMVKQFILSHGDLQRCQ